MNPEALVERLFEALINGDRATARDIANESTQQGLRPEDLVCDVYWPTYSLIEKLHRDDQLSTLGHHLATRLLRVLVDQAAHTFQQAEPIGRSIFAVCGPTDADELAGQIATDLLEAAGYTISYAGGGIATDELLEHVQSTQPDVFLLFASAPTDLPEIRAMIDRLNEIGACRKTQIVVGGGVFNRAEGLAEEIGADLWATEPLGLVQEIVENPEQRATPDQRTVGRKRVNRAA